MRGGAMSGLISREFAALTAPMGRAFARRPVRLWGAQRGDWIPLHLPLFKGESCAVPYATPPLEKGRDRWGSDWC